MSSKKKKAIVLSELEKVLLTLLHDRSLYGLEFVNAIQKASNGRREVGFGSLYPTLTRMEKKGFVRWYWGDEQTGPRRKYYDITPYGKEVLQEDWRFHEELRAVDVASQDVKDAQTSAEFDESSLISAKFDGR